MTRMTPAVQSLRGHGSRSGAPAASLSSRQTSASELNARFDAFKRRSTRTEVPGRPLEPGREVPVHDAREMAKAQAEVDEADAELWRVREELLGWTRPPWARAAALVPDWFSDEDRVYDDIENRPSS
jgi:hypothetical protein